MNGPGIRSPNLPLGTNLGEFIGHEIVGPTKSLRRFSHASVLGALEAVANSFTVGGGVIFTTLSQALSNLNYNVNQMAWVIQDPTPANNGVYQKTGSSGSGSWARRGDLPYSFYRAVNEGAGTPNAIQATNGYPMASKNALIVVNVTDTNTDTPVTLSLNGSTPLTIKTASGNDPVVGGLTAGMMIAGYIDEGGTQFRMLSDQASAAIQAACEAALAGAESARDGAEAFLDLAVEAADLAATVGAGDVPTCPSVAIAKLSSFPATRSYLIVAGYATHGDAPLATYTRVAEEPSHGGKFRSADRFLPNGSTDSDDGGWWEEKTGKINYFDFIPPELRNDIRTGVDTTTDQATYWQAFRDALQAVAVAGGVPHGIVPQCVIRTSVAPNFAIPNLHLETEGCPKIISTSTAPGFLCDATGMGVGGWGLYGLKVGSLMAGTTTGSKGIDIRYCHQSYFDSLFCLGATAFGIYLSFLVSTVLNKPACSTSYLNGDGYLSTPNNGIYLTAEEGDEKGTACGWCTLIGPIGEYVPNGIVLDRAQGTLLLGGVAESCTSIGLVIGQPAHWTNVCGTDFEANTTFDVHCSASYCTFTGIKSQDKFQMWGIANSNLITGGTFNNIACDVATGRNTFRDLRFAVQSGGSISDSASSFFNRFVNCVNHQTEKVYSEWKTISGLGVSSTGGAAPTATAAGRFFVDGAIVNFTLEVTVSSGSGSGALTVSMPYAATSLRSYSWGGIEIGHAGDGVTGYLAAGSSTMQIRHSSGTYPGDESGNFIVISGSYEVA